MEFNVENIMNGSFDAEHSKTSNWEMFSSLRLLLESGQVLSDEQQKLMDSVKYKWYYYKKKSDNNSGPVIVALHKKGIKSWLYVTMNLDGTYTENKDIKTAKENI